MKRGLGVGDYVALGCALFILVSLVLSLMDKVPYAFTAFFFLLFLAVWVVWGFFKQSRKDMIVTFCIFAAVLVVLSFFITEKGSRNENDRSRIGIIGSIAHDNVFYEKGFMIGSDKIKVGDKFYSSKPPLLTFLGAGAYKAIYEVYKMRGRKVDPYVHDVYFWLVFLLIAVPSALGAAVFYKVLGFVSIWDGWRVLLSLSLVFGTLIFSFSSVLNNHTITAAALAAGFYFYLCSRHDKSWRSAIGSGFFFALAAALEIPSVIWALIFFALTFFKAEKKFWLFFLAGMLVPLAFHFSFQYNITGEFVPPQMSSIDYGDWENSPWDKIAEKNAKYKVRDKIWDVTFGNRGLFTYTPFFVLSFVGLGFWLSNRKGKFWLEALCIFLGIFLLMIPFYSIHIKDYSGPGWGFRWFIQFIPFLIFCTSALFEKEHRRVWLVGLFILLLAYSVYTGYLGTMYAFEVHHAPPFYFNYVYNLNLSIKTNM